MTAEELEKYVGKYVVLNIVTWPRVDYRQRNFQRIREIRKLERIVDDGPGKKCLWLGQGVILDMKSKEVLAGSVETDPQIPMPIDTVYKAATKQIIDLLEEHFKNQDYFINGTIV